MDINQNRKFVGIIALLLLATFTLAIYFFLKGNLLLIRLISLGGVTVWGILIAFRGGLKKKWHWILLGLLIISLVIHLGNYFIYIFSSHSQIFSLQSPSDNDLTQWKTYKNPNYGFEFKYPTNFKTFNDLTSEEQKVFSSNIVLCAPHYPNTIVCLPYTDTRYKDTDFQGAALLVQKTSATGQVCLMPTKYSTHGTINEIPFAYYNFNEVRHYETYHNGQCLDVTLLVFTDPSVSVNNPSIEELSVNQKTEMFNYLTQILSTFKFTK